MVDTLIGTSLDSHRGYKKDFKSLCSHAVDPRIASGCAILAMNIDGGDDDTISNYYYAPGINLAYKNTIYMEKTLKLLQKNTPTSLIQQYYSCVLAPWPALFNAIGIGTSTAGVFVFVGILCYVALLLFILNYVFDAKIPTKRQMVNLI